MTTNPYESPEPAEKKTGRIAGLVTASIVFAIGVVLLGRMTWIALMVPDKNDDEWKQVYVVGAVAIAQVVYGGVALFVRTKKGQ